MEVIENFFRKLTGRQSNIETVPITDKYKNLQQFDVFSDRDGEVLIGLVNTNNQQDTYNYGLRIKVNNVGEAKLRLRVLLVEHKGKTGQMSEYVLDERESTGGKLPYHLKTEQVGWNEPQELTRNSSDPSLNRLRNAAKVHSFSTRNGLQPAIHHIGIIKDAVEKGIEHYQTADRTQVDEWARTGKQTLILANSLLSGAKRD